MAWLEMALDGSDGNSTKHSLKNIDPSGRLVPGPWFLVFVTY